MSKKVFLRFCLPKCLIHQDKYLAGFFGWLQDRVVLDWFNKLNTESGPKYLGKNDYKKS